MIRINVRGNEYDAGHWLGMAIGYDDNAKATGRLVALLLAKGIISEDEALAVVDMTHDRSGVRFEYGPGDKA